MQLPQALRLHTVFTCLKSAIVCLMGYGCAAPIKLFGDLHGQFGDLMRLFEEYGTPSTAGDITYIDYLFLGDYVDRGAHSLETICLLLALKIEHPKNVHLIRGNHEVRLCPMCQTLSSYMCCSISPIHRLVKLKCLQCVYCMGHLSGARACICALCHCSSSAVEQGPALQASCLKQLWTHCLQCSQWAGKHLACACSLALPHCS